MDRVAQAIVRHKTRVIDFDLRNYFDNIRHDRLLAKVAKRVNDNDVMHLLKIMLKANGRHGVPQGGVIRRASLRPYRRGGDWKRKHGRDAVTHRNRKGEATGNTNCDLNRRASLRPY